MSDRSELERRVQRARVSFDPSAAQRERVRAGLASRADFRVPGESPSDAVASRQSAGSRGEGRSTRGLAETRRAATASRVLSLLKAGALIGVGFALGYWVSELRASERSLAASAASELVTGSASVGSAHGSASDGSASDGSASDDSASDDSEANRSALRGSASNGLASEGSASNGSASSTPAPPRRAPRRSHTRGADAASAPREELVLLQRAERAIRAGDGALAHSFIDELEARFPKTIWREERDAVLVLAACTLEEPGASERARTFLARRASSMYHDRITSLCRLADGSAFGTSSPDGSPIVEHSSVRRKIP